MARRLQLACVLFAAAGIGLCDQAAKGGKAATTPAFRPTLPKGGVLPKGVPKAPALRNPASGAARLYRAAPQDRERVLERLPAVQQARMRNELEWFDGLPKDQQQIVLKRSEVLAALPPEKQRAFRQQMQALNQLPVERRRAVRQALVRLQTLSDDERRELLDREEFRSRFSADELQIVTDLAAVMIPRL